MNYEPIINPKDGSVNMSVTTSSFIISSERKLESFKFIENEEGNFIEVVHSIIPLSIGQTATISTLYTTSNSKKMIKEVYGLVDGVLKLIKTSYGLEHPGYYVPPAIEWEE